MAQIYTADASAFLRAFNPGELGHAESRRFFERVREEAVPLIEPALLLPEIAAGAARGWDNTVLAQALVAAIKQMPQLTLIAIDSVLADAAADIAAQQRLRGSDAVYAAVALRARATLITLDREHLTRLTTLLRARTPAQALAEWTP